MKKQIKQKGKSRGIYIPDHIMQWLKEEASRDRRSVSSFLSILIEGIIKEQKIKK